MFKTQNIESSNVTKVAILASTLTCCALTSVHHNRLSLLAPFRLARSTLAPPAMTMPTPGISEIVHTATCTNVTPYCTHQYSLSNPQLLYCLPTLIEQPTCHPKQN